jgi:hypothetical protein
VELAEVLIKEADEELRPEALEHLDLAIPELGDMKMQLTLERALEVCARPSRLPPYGRLLARWHPTR